MRALLYDPAAFTTAAVVIGLIVGSFLNVVIHRLPRMLEREWRAQCAELTGATADSDDATYNLISPRSHCPSCRAPVRPWHNIPLLGYLWLRGRCAECGERIGVRYPVVELASGLATGAVAWHFGPGAQALAGAGLTWALLALAVIDLDTQLLPDDITLPLLWAGLLVNVPGLFTDLSSAVLGAAAGYLALWLVYHAFRLATGKRGMGHGDFKLLAALGAWFGWQQLPALILLSSLVGAAVGIALMVFAGHRRGQPIPFGPFLAGAGWLALLWGPQLSSWLLRGIGAS